MEAEEFFNVDKETHQEEDVQDQEFILSFIEELSLKV